MDCWRQIQKNNFVKWDQLADFLCLTEEQKGTYLKRKHFPLNLPFRLASKIQKGTLEDPILKQFLPTVMESDKVAGFIDDPVGDALSRCTDQLIHKYHGRVLLVPTAACAMHCRYCFRQNFDYRSEDKTCEKEIEYIATHSEVTEVILSGGDPLSLNDSVLEILLRKIESIPHVKRIRFHTRFPIGIPERITERFVEMLASMRPAIWFIVHCNHAKELDDDVFASLKTLRKRGIILLSQTVLLRGVNDSVEALSHLFESLADHGIIPYYLHQLDRVKGAAHFEVAEERGIELMRHISAKLSGYAVPKYVKEIPGESGKSLITF